MRAAPQLAALVVPDGGAGVLATLETKSEERDAGHGCTNTRTYPNVMGLVPAARNKLVNDYIHGLLGKVDEVGCTGTEDMLPWFSEIGIEVEAQAPGYMALTIGTSTYSGGAHPMPGSWCELLDTSSGQDVSLLDVLGPGAVSKVVDQITRGLRDQWKDSEFPMFFDPATESAPLSEGELCYLGPHTLEARYPQYAIAPYAYGPMSASVDVDPILPLVPASPASKALFGTRGG
jgi:hypothetical protein